MEQQLYRERSAARRSVPRLLVAVLHAQRGESAVRETRAARGPGLQQHVRCHTQRRGRVPRLRQLLYAYEYNYECTYIGPSDLCARRHQPHHLRSVERRISPCVPQAAAPGALRFARATSERHARIGIRCAHAAPETHALRRVRTLLMACVEYE